jgi:hypothetical protein
LPNAVTVDGLFFPQRIALGLDTRESTPGLKRKVVFINAETRSLKRSKELLSRTLEIETSTNTIERICDAVGNDLEAAAREDWKEVLDGEVTVPKLAIVSYDGGRIRTRKTGCGPGVHLSGKGWNETKNAIFVNATSETSVTDPEPQPPKCFFNPEHVAKLTEMAKTKETAREDEELPDEAEPKVAVKKPKRKHPKHKPRRIHRTLIASMKNSKEFGQQMAREAKRRRFDEAIRKSFVGDGLTCNWSIHEEHFSDYTPILDFVHAVSYVYRGSIICHGKCDLAWSTYTRWMTLVWRGEVVEVISELEQHQATLGDAEATASADDACEQLRLVIQYLRNNRERMKYADYRQQGLPTTSAWMESAVKEMNFRIKGTEMFWNNPEGAEAILQIRAASLSDDDRLARFLSHRPGEGKLRREASTETQAA